MDDRGAADLLTVHYDGLNQQITGEERDYEYRNDTRRKAIGVSIGNYPMTALHGKGFHLLE